MKLIALFILAISLFAGSLHAQTTGKIQVVFKPGSQDEFVTITDANGKVYRNARVTKVDESYQLRFVHDEGAASLPLEDFPGEVKARFKLAELKALKTSPAPRLVAGDADSSAAPTSTGFAEWEAAIRVRAAREWPQDFRMQKYEIERQSKAMNLYLGMFGDGVEGVPLETVKRIIAQAKIQWKDDHCMVLYESDTQIKAWRNLHAK